MILIMAINISFQYFVDIKHVCEDKYFLASFKNTNLSIIQ